MTLEKRKIAIVTGANNGVGYGVCQRLAESNENIKIVMACRNIGKATQARDSLLSHYPGTDVEIEQLDVGNAKSVFNFCAAINSKYVLLLKDDIDLTQNSFRYTHIDYLFCNAGILDSSHVDWKLTAYMFFTDTVALIEQADVTIQIVGEVNPDGLGKVFATNVFGHYVIVSPSLIFCMYHRSNLNNILKQ
jgi:17beta-estradiol 17-dehydrogenase/3beta-hydroxysteroid 3-dehydrogenase